MPYNNQSDITIEINENSFRKLFREIYEQCPELFTFATNGIIERAAKGLKLLCEGKNLPVEPAAYTRIGNMPIMSVSPGSIGLDFYCRVNKFDIEFPKLRPINIKDPISISVSVQDLIRKLNEPNSQLMLLTMEVIMAMPVLKPLSKSAVTDFVKDAKDKKISFPPIVLAWETLDCFKCTVYCLLNYNTPTIITVEDVEIEEITPNGLESIMETYFFMTLSLGVLPQLTPLLADLLFVKPAVLIKPVDSLPFNPHLKDNSLNIYFNVND